MGATPLDRSAGDRTGTDSDRSSSLTTRSRTTEQKHPHPHCSSQRSLRRMARRQRCRAMLSYIITAALTALTIVGAGCLIDLLPSSSWFVPVLAALAVCGRFLFIPDNPQSPLTRFFLAGPPHRQILPAGYVSAGLEAIGVITLALFALLLITHCRRRRAWVRGMPWAPAMAVSVAVALFIGCVQCGPITAERSPQHSSAWVRTSLYAYGRNRRHTSLNLSTSAIRSPTLHTNLLFPTRTATGIRTL